MIIAIDGPAAAGKGTLGRRLAAHYGLAYLDSGLLYRAVGLRLLAAGGDPRDEGAAMAAARAIKRKELDDPRLRDEEVARAASTVAAIPRVRAALVPFQRRFAARPPGGARGAVIDGRDIGTVVCPEATIKLFLSARAAVRAKRRLGELRQRGQRRIYARVLAEMRERDARDSGRAIAPLAVAEDAYVLDTTRLDADGVFSAAVALIEARGRGRKA